jgi:hypothetical protein
MKPALAILALICVAMVPPVPSVKHHKSAAMERGAGATKLIAKIAPKPTPTTNTTVWLYSPSINPLNLWFNIEASSDLAHWSVVVSNASGPGEVRVKRTDPPGFFRLAGRSSP